MNQAFDPLNLLLLAIAVVVFFKLRSVLGTRTGHEKTIDFPPLGKDGGKDKEASARGEGKVIPLPGSRAPAGNEEEITRGLPPEEEPPVWEGVAEEGSPLAKALETMKGRDPAFTVQHFLEGAGIAYEMIVTAFARGDKKTLKPLLTPEVYKGFAAAIDERRKQGQTLELEFVGLDDAKIVAAETPGNKGAITVKFVSKIITALKDGGGNVIEGDPNRLTTVTDVWTFERDLTSPDPNWKLAATEAQEDS